jgi:ssDNA-specific exonuclease RecJ
VLNEYLQQKVRSGSSGGYSDVTFLNKFKLQDEGDKPAFEELYFISVKYFQNEKEIGEYDIGKLCGLIEHHKKANRTIKVCIFLKDKAAAIAKFEKQRMSSGVLMKYINPGGKYENVYDSSDLRAAYFKLKKLLEQFNYLETQPDIEHFEKTYLRVLRRPFIPRFHQELFILKINKLMDDGKKNILVGAIPRSGKSYIMAGTILEHVKRTEAAHPGKKLKFLMMTPAPNETFGEYRDIFANHIDFQQLGIDVIEYKGDVAISDVCVDKTRHCVIIISKQKLGWSAGSKAEALLESEDAGEDEIEVEPENKEEEGVDVVKIKQRIHALLGERPDINVMFLDEAHFGMSTEKAQKIVEALNSAIANTVKIYVTATYNKPLQAYGVESACTLTWDMNDIKTMKTLSAATINDNPVKAQFGTQIYESTLAFFGDKSGESLIEKLKSEYAVYPKPYLITSVWDKEFLNAEKLKIGDTEFGWDMNKLFTTNGDQFVNAEQMKEMMRYYFGYPDKREGYDKQSFYRTRGILPRIRNICLNRCRTLQPNHKTTQLWFLPLGTGKIKDKVKALINLLVNSNEFADIKRSYHFFVAVDMNDKTKKGRTVNGVTYMGNPHNIKQDIETVEKEITDGKIKADNLIILAGQRLQLGISLRNADIVTLWNSISSADAIFQIMFRSMTEVVAPPCTPDAAEYCPAKSFGFMVDMNPQRALTNVSLFNTNVRKMADNADKADVQQYRQITDLINIDEDVLLDKYGESEEEKDKFVTDLFQKLYASWNVNTANVKKIISKLSFDMTKL